MKLLLTSSGISNGRIETALIDLLGKPISEANALFIPTGIYPFPGSSGKAWEAICGKTKSPLVQLGWKSVGVLELTALPSIEKKNWVAAVEQTDALLVWGGDVLYLSHWMRESGLTELLLSLQCQCVYVGVSAGSMAVSGIFSETCPTWHSSAISPLTSEEIVFTTPGGEMSGNFITGQGMGLVDFAVIPHLDNKDHPDASAVNAEKWAARLPVPVYAIDDQTAIKVTDGTVEVISEGNWKLFNKADG